MLPLMLWWAGSTLEKHPRARLALFCLAGAGAAVQIGRTAHAAPDSSYLYLALVQAMGAGLAVATMRRPGALTGALWAYLVCLQVWLRDHDWHGSLWMALPLGLAALPSRPVWQAWGMVAPGGLTVLLLPWRDLAGRPSLVQPVDPWLPGLDPRQLGAVLVGLGLASAWASPTSPALWTLLCLAGGWLGPLPLTWGGVLLLLKLKPRRGPDCWARPCFCWWEPQLACPGRRAGWGSVPRPVPHP